MRSLTLPKKRKTRFYNRSNKALYLRPPRESLITFLQDISSSSVIHYIRQICSNFFILNFSASHVSMLHVQMPSTTDRTARVDTYKFNATNNYVNVLTTNVFPLILTFCALCNRWNKVLLFCFFFKILFFVIACIGAEIYAQPIC